MKIYKIILVIAFQLFILLPAVSEENKSQSNKKYVLLDSDVVDMLDDGTAMLMLAKNSNIELLGVTTVSGNDWVQYSTASAIRQLEAIGRTDIPVVQGSEYPLRSNRVQNIAEEFSNFGYPDDNYPGAFKVEKNKAPKTWQEAYHERYNNEEPTFAPLEKDATDFIIESINNHPGEVIIIAIGPCTNLAKAFTKNPQAASLVKEIVYMGGAYFCSGNVTPAAEYNFWFDPEAARITFQSAIPKKTVFPLDVCNKISFNKKEYEASNNLVKNPKLAPLAKQQYRTYEYNKNPKLILPIFDVLATAYVIDPSIITKKENYLVDINDTYSISYGESLAYKNHAPQGANKADIVLDSNKNKILKMFKELYKEF